MTSTPHTCPTCSGTKSKPDPRSGQMVPCPTCDHGGGSTGVVWEGSPEEAAVAAGENPREINGL